MLTPFGIAVRKLRLDRGLRLLDLAELLGQSSAYVSAVETGKKPIPHSYVVSIGSALRLSAAETKDLQRAADRTRNEIKVSDLAGAERELVAEFARKVDSLPAASLESIRKIVFKRLETDEPFRRRRGLKVSGKKTRDLWNFAAKVNSVVAPQGQTNIPIMDFLEFRLGSLEDGFYLEVCDQASMGADEGRVVAGQKSIQLREDVYSGAWKGNGRHRFTACHELGHYLMHREFTMARSCDDSHPIYQDAEWQADTFAGGLMMPAMVASRFPSPDVAALSCGMTQKAATVMMQKYQKEGLI